MENFGRAATVGAGSSAYLSPPKNAYPGAEVDRVLGLDQIAGSINATNQNLAELLAGFRNHIDGLIGIAPTGSDEGASSPPDISRLHGLSRSTDTTRELVEYLRTELDRLRGI